MSWEKYTIIFMVLIGSGCGTTLRIPEIAYMETNRELQGKHVEIEMVNGEVYSGEGVQLNRDSTSLISINGNVLARQIVSTKDIGKISYRNRGKGAIQGLLIGTCIGAGVGIVYGEVLANYNDSLENDIQEFLRAVGFGLLGIPVGGVVGASSGARQMYILNEYDPFQEGDRIVIETVTRQTYIGIVISFYKSIIEIDTKNGSKTIPLRTIKKIDRIED